MNWSLFLSNDLMWVILGLIVLSGILYLYNLNNDNRSDIYLTDLITVNGKLSERKLTRFGAWIVSTWGFVYLISHDKLSEWYFIGYMGAWVANALIGKMVKDPNNEENSVVLERKIKIKKSEEDEEFERKL